MSNEGRALTWDDEITEDGQEFILLPAGEYEFKVLTFERAQTNGEGKLGVCPMAIMTLEIDGRELGMVTLKDRFVLHQNVQWRIGNFFSAVGLKKKGEAVKMNWTGAINLKGICEVGIRKYNDKDYNEIKSYVSKEDVQTQDTTW